MHDTLSSLNSFYTVSSFVSIGFLLLVGLKLLLRYHSGQIDPSNEIDVFQKTIIVTGASAGIGKSTSEELANRGARVIMACRNIKKAEKVVEDIERPAENWQIIMELNLASLESVRRFVATFQSNYAQLDILINNAGQGNPPGVKILMEEGFEEQFATNQLGHFLLTNLLLPQLKKATPSRVVIVSSEGHRYGNIDFDDILTGGRATSSDYKVVSKQYCNSKLANALFNLELSKKLKGTGVSCYALCPGFVDTEIMKWKGFFGNVLMRLIKCVVAKSPQEGAATIIHCALSKSVTNHCGEMYRNCEFWDPCRRPKLSEKDAAILWEKSAVWVKLK